MSRGTAMSISSSGWSRISHDRGQLLGADDRMRRRRRRRRRCRPCAAGGAARRDRRRGRRSARPPSSARSAWRLATKIVRTPLLGERLRGQLARLAGADDQHLAVAQVADRARGRGRPRRSTTLTRLPAERGLGADALAGLQRGREQAVGQRAGRAGLERRLVGALDLALDLGLADDHRLQAAGHAEQLARGVAVARRVDDRRRARSGGCRPGSPAPTARCPRRRPGRRRRGRARCGCRSRSRPPRGPRVASSSVRVKRRASVSVSAIRSRSATGAVLCEMPSAQQLAHAAVLSHRARVLSRAFEPRAR